MPRPLPPVETLRALFDYEPETGVLRWRARQATNEHLRAWNTRFAGKPAGAGMDKLRVAIFGRSYLAHRVIWKWVHEAEPDCVDHIDGDQLNNRLINLRNGSQYENNKNCALRSDNSSGHAGVYFSRERAKFRVWIQDRGESLYIGQFTSRDDAIAARRKAQHALGFSERHGRPAYG